MDLILATSNLHKIREFRALLKPYSFLEIYSLKDYPHYVSPEEVGVTFEENSILKAETAATQLKKWALADDSGLVVPALNGKPGVFSSRYAGENSTDKENREKLLKDMQNLTDLQRSAYFECCISLASPEGSTYVVRGLCEGLIIQEERGKNGFGYDPIFQKYDYNQTFAELNESVKNQISHRAKAFQKILLIIEGKMKLAMKDLTSR